MERRSHSVDATPVDLIDEEHIPNFDPRAVLQVRPGQTFNNKYTIVGKVGWGTASTVWIAEDLQPYVLYSTIERPK